MNNLKNGKILSWKGQYKIPLNIGKVVFDEIPFCTVEIYLDSIF